MTDTNKLVYKDLKDITEEDWILIQKYVQHIQFILGIQKDLLEQQD